jgi:hypothetical protein
MVSKCSIPGELNSLSSRPKGRVNLVKASTTSEPLDRGSGVEVLYRAPCLAVVVPTGPMAITTSQQCKWHDRRSMSCEEGLHTRPSPYAHVHGPAPPYCNAAHSNQRWPSSCNGQKSAMLKVGSSESWCGAIDVVQLHDTATWAASPTLRRLCVVYHLAPWRSGSARTRPKSSLVSPPGPVSHLGVGRNALNPSASAGVWLHVCGVRLVPCRDTRRMFMSCSGHCSGGDDSRDSS